MKELWHRARELDRAQLAVRNTVRGWHRGNLWLCWDDTGRYTLKYVRARYPHNEWREVVLPDEVP